MGRIHDEVYNFAGFRHDHTVLLNKFLPDFDVTWAHKYSKFGADITAFFLKPAEHTKETTGFEKEILLVLSPYPELHSATYQAADAFMAESFASGRIEPLAYVLVAPVPNLRHEVREHQIQEQQSRLVIPFTNGELISNTDAWFVRNRFTQCLAPRDLFDVQRALINDNYYFGRTELVTDLIDRFRHGENTGLFGLRKTGKTSAVLKLLRSIRANREGVGLYIDAQDTDINMRRWWQLLSCCAQKLSEEVTKVTGQTVNILGTDMFDPENASASFKKALRSCFDALPAGQQRLIIVLDEIEHISPDLCPPGAQHWNSDFLPFWKTLRAIQNIEPRLVFIIVGVNGWAIEQASIAQQDNPLFLLAGQRYMPNFSREEVRDMVRTTGRPMGMRFEEGAYTYLTERYGGHPALIKLACSWHHKRITSARPVDVKTSDLVAMEELRDSTLVTHVIHILEVLKLWYTEEYDMLDMLARGFIDDFIALAADEPLLKHHLDQYGLVRWESDIPKINIAIVSRYLRTSAASSNKTPSAATKDEWLELVADVTRLRNKLEPKLRRYVKRVLRIAYGADRWIDPIYRAFPEREQQILKGVDKDVILNERAYLSTLIAVVESEWGKFNALEHSKKYPLRKSEISTLLRYVNTQRADAHAKSITQSEVSLLAVVCATLNGALDEQLAD